MKRDKKGIRDEDGWLYSEKAVLELLLKGKSRDEICEALDMPLGTLNSCCTRIYKRAGCKNLAELLVKHHTERILI